MYQIRSNTPLAVLIIASLVGLALQDKMVKICIFEKLKSLKLSEEAWMNVLYTGTRVRIIFNCSDRLKTFYSIDDPYLLSENPGASLPSYFPAGSNSFFYAFLQEFSREFSRTYLRSIS